MMPDLSEPRHPQSLLVGGPRDQTTHQVDLTGETTSNNSNPPDRPALITSRDPFMASTTSLDPVLGPDMDGSGNRMEPNSTIKLSRRRWFILFAMTVFGLSAAVSGDTSPVLSLILELLDLRVDRYMYITQIFYYLMAFSAMPTAWLVDRYGIKRSIFVALGLYALNCVFKALMYSPNLPRWHEYRMYYYIISGFIGVQVNSIFFLLPLKVSETWFSASERSVAWTVMISQLEVGVCIASFVYPRIMPTLEQIEIFAYINMGTLVTTIVVCLACVTVAAPEHPPSERQARANKEKVVPFKIALKRMVTNKDVLVHIIHLAIFESCTLTISSILQSILTSSGHSKIFAGNFMSINALVSIIMLILMSSLVHKVSNMTLTCKLSSISQSILYIVYIITLVQRAPGWIVVSVSIVLTIARSWTTPNFTNMTAHLACGLVSQATIIGLSITLTVITMTVVQVAFVSLIVFHHKTSSYTYSLIFLSIICAINEAIYQLLFQGKPAKETTGEPIADHPRAGNDRATVMID